MMQRAAANSGAAVISEHAASDLRCRSASLMASSSSRRRRRTADLEAWDGSGASVMGSSSQLSALRYQPINAGLFRLTADRLIADSFIRFIHYVAGQAKDYSRPG